ncbi:hypothetical protein E3T54_02970 [Cryobacterium sp. Sr8]|uniref:hypothetical protein n=1 Tax=Cryobacterium sp. Sr8 TaxID=1259203 RepID=UPI00106D603F|nr:hypothetical protein [Cryobacterium sp. Sr8]TFD80719.1 hypothetical protein E3T54_02970 [Cryobacterium sp. Sr8]
MAELSWVSTDAQTGVILADLPLLEVDSVKSTIGRYESTMANLPLPGAPVDWQRATLEGASNLILLSQSTDKSGQPVGESVPIWGGMVTRCSPNESDLVPLSLATLESYFDRRYVGDETFVGVGQNVIVATLVDKYVKAGAKPGLPIRVAYTGAGTLRDRTYADQDDKTIYSVLSDLMGVEGGPEWTVGWEWQHNPERITPVLYVGDRIGRAVTPGLGAAATFEMPGPVTAFSLDRDYSAGRGANDVMAVSTADGNTRPQSPRQVAANTSRPTFEFRWTPSTSITNVSTLTGHARAALTILANGPKPLTMSAAIDGAPELGTDWSIGDDIGFAIGGLEDDPANPGGRESVPAFPGGFAGVARAIGWELSLTGVPTVTPTLASTEITGG